MTDQELIDLLDQRSVDQWPAEQLALLHQRVRSSPRVRQAFLARLRLEEALQGTLARPPYATAALCAGVAALLSQGVCSAAARAAAWWWGTWGTAALVLTVAVGSWTLRRSDPPPAPKPPLVQRSPLPLVAPEPSDPEQAAPTDSVAWSPSDAVPTGFARDWDPEAPAPPQWSLPMGTLPLVAPGPERPGP